MHARAIRDFRLALFLVELVLTASVVGPCTGDMGSIEKTTFPFSLKL